MQSFVSNNNQAPALVESTKKSSGLYAVLSYLVTTVSALCFIAFLIGVAPEMFPQSVKDAFMIGMIIVVLLGYLGAVLIPLYLVMFLVYVIQAMRQISRLKSSNESAQFTTILLIFNVSTVFIFFAILQTILNNLMPVIF